MSGGIAPERREPATLRYWGRTERPPGPRPGTRPGLDTTAQLIVRAKKQEYRDSVGPGSTGQPGAKATDATVIVTITDGLENAYREFSHGAVRELVAEQEAQGWTFVFLSAVLDAYDQAWSFGYRDGG